LSPKCDLKAVLLSFPHLVPAFLTGWGFVGLRGAGEPLKLGGELGMGQGPEREKLLPKTRKWWWWWWR